MRFIISLFLVFVCTQAFAGYDGPTVYDPTVNASVNASIPTGPNVIGKVGVDQTTPGVTNAANQADVAAVMACMATATTYAARVACALH